MPLDIDMAQIAQLFIDESVEGLDIMESGLLNLDLGDADSETMNSIFRAAHSIKGGGATFGFTEISEFAHHLETLLDEMRTGERQVTKAAVDLMLESVDCIRAMIESLRDGDIDTTQAKVLEAQLTAMLNGSAGVPVVADDEQAIGTEHATAQKGEWHIVFEPHPHMLKSCNDPVRILRELRDLGEMQVECKGMEALELGKFDPEECLLAWDITLSEDAKREDIESAFEWVLDECTLLIERSGAVSDVAIDDTIVVAEKEPEKTPANKKTTAASTSKKAKTTSSDGGSIRVNIDKVDALINLVGEIVITQSMLSRFNGDFDFTNLGALREGLSQLSRNTRELQESVMAIRMLPISSAFSRFPRLVRDTGNALGKDVELRLIGEGTEVDKTVLEKIGDPLVHLVRNSLDHGLETPEERIAAGKPATGILELSAHHEGGNIVIEVVDDGAGINKDKVLEKARKKGLVGPDEVISDERINNLIFMPGFSTVDQVSDLSGRGVGMDVVRRNIADLGGNVSVVSTVGAGSRFTIRLPLTLAILDGQLVRVGEESYIISLVSIVETIQVKAEQINSIAGAAEMFKLRDEYLPILRLHEMFGIKADSKRIQDGLLVVAEANGHTVGIFVDDLLEQQQIVIKSLEANYRQMQGISGATILGDGKVALIIDVPGLIQLFFEQTGSRSPIVGQVA